MSLALNKIADTPEAVPVRSASGVRDDRMAGIPVLTAFYHAQAGIPSLLRLLLNGNHCGRCLCGARDRGCAKDGHPAWSGTVANGQ